MKWDEVPDRRVGLVLGLVGGIVGMAARRYYIQHLEARLLPASLDMGATEAILGDVIHTHALDTISLIGTQYQPGETAQAAAGRILYQRLTGNEPSPETKLALADLIQWLYGLATGGAYGGTRTTTASRDLAGGFFYGIRLWLGDTFGLSIFGLRPGPTALPLSYHVRRLLSFWVFTFVTTAITRLLYVLVEKG